MLGIPLRSITVRSVTFAFLSLLSLAVTPARAAEEVGQSTRPNFVFIFADDWGWGDLGCYGHPVLRTPNLDRLARQGTLFTQFYVASGVCSPSRTAIMTGHFPARHRVHGHFATPESNAARGMPDFLDAKIPTVTGLLKKSGYTVGHFGKWHLGGTTDAPRLDAYGIDDHKAVNANDDFPNLWGKDFRARSTEIIIDETIRFVELHQDRPFYVQAWLLDTHAYLQPTEEQMKAYPRHNGALKIYYSVATDADKQIGRLMKRLDELGLAENTVLVFSSDNGPEDIGIGNASHSGVGSRGPFRGRKRSLYAGGVRMPFIVRWPAGAPAGKV
ncbi:MAG: sulfatase-like hydrolase/transferase, partial [Candidatus Nealsonbacteria bacterium]|nr:sulfatase-like hydrolase/transferase [Candidatus Nealsonbacteria bacterium]